MTNEPTPETDAMFTDNVPEDAQIVVFCERLERERNAARAQRDEHIARNNDSLLALHIATAERDEARADVARLRSALEGIVEYGKLCSDGDATDCARLIYLANQALTTLAQ
jgi:hypothetical protein